MEAEAGRVIPGVVRTSKPATITVTKRRNFSNRNRFIPFSSMFESSIFDQSLKPWICTDTNIDECDYREEKIDTS